MGETDVNLEDERLVTEQDTKDEQFWAEDAERRKEDTAKRLDQHEERRQRNQRKMADLKSRWIRLEDRLVKREGEHSERIRSAQWSRMSRQETVS